MNVAAPFGTLGFNRFGRLGFARPGPIIPQISAFDFANANGLLPAGVTYGARTGILAYPIFRKVLRGVNAYATSGDTVPVHEIGCVLSKALANEATNPKMTGGSDLVVGGTTDVTTSAGDAGDAPAIGDYIVRLKAVAHGRSVGDLVNGNGVTWGGRTLNLAVNNLSTNNGYFTITKVPDADHIEFMNYQPALSIANSTAGTIKCVTPTAGALPTGWSTSGASSRKFRMFQQQDGEFQATPQLGFRRTVDFFGTGTGYLTFQNIAVTPGTPISIYQIIYGYPKVLDNMQFANQTLEYFLIQKDSGGNPVGVEQLVNLDTQIGSSIFNPCQADFVASHASVASVDIGIKASGTLSGDCRLRLYEPMISKSRSLDGFFTLPSGSSGTSSAGASRISDLSVLFQSQTVSIEYDSRVISNADYDVIACTSGGLELRAAGASWPRDLVLTDGTNTITLPGILRNDYQTQGFNRVSISFGANFMALAHNDFNFVSSGSTAAFNLAAQVGNWRFNRAMDGSHEGAMLLKFVEFSSLQRTLVEAQILCKPTRNVPWQVPGIDFAVGRLGTYGNPAGAMPTSGTNVLLGNASSGVPQAFGNGTCMWSGVGSGAGGPALAQPLSNRVINFGANQPKNQLFQNMDLRGWRLAGSTNTVLDSLTFRECLFDASVIGLTTSGPVIGTNNGLGAAADWPNLLFENCTIDLGAAPNDLINAFVVSNVSGLIFRRCLILGVVTDIINALEMLCEECRFIAASGRLNKHSDAVQFNGCARGDFVSRRNFWDGRNLKGGRCDINSSLIAASSVGRGSYTVKQEEDIILGFTNPTQVRGRPACLITANDGALGGSPSVWGAMYSGGALVALPAIIVNNNRYDMATNSGNELDVHMGRALRFVEPGGGAITVGKVGTSKSVMSRLGLEVQGIYPITMPSTYIGGGLFQTTTTAPDSINPLTTAAVLSGSGATLRVSNQADGTSSSNGSNAPLNAGDVITIQGVDFTVVAGTSGVNTNLGIAETMAVIMGKLAAATGLTVDLWDIPVTLTNNKTLLREKAI